MDKYSQIGVPPQDAARQLEVHAALSDQVWKIERAEAAVAELLTRISPLLRKADAANSCGAPVPTYSCDLALQIGKFNERIEGLADRVNRIIGQLEI